LAQNLGDLGIAQRGKKSAFDQEHPQI
jgi:hypothetical protein